MASFPGATTADSGGTDDEPTQETPEDTGDSRTSPIGQLAERARAVADVLAPFTSLLTAIVQGVTVWQLIKTA